MPKQEEVATVTINGQSFSDWDSVRVEQQASSAIIVCQLSVTEKIGGRTTFASLQIKPGDKATVTLAGQQACNGVVTQRQASYDARNHGVLIVIKSAITDIVDSSAPLKATQFKDYALKPIAEALLKPFGIKVLVEGASKSFEKAFKELSIIPGESVFTVIERLARFRGMQVHDDPQGNLVLASGTVGQGGDLVEGRNILSANCLIQDETAFKGIDVPTQQRGDENTPDETARKPAGKVEGSSTRNRTLIVPSEQPGDAEDMAKRAEHEAATLLGKTINARVTVQGWLKPSGGLWKVRETIKVTSPMLLLNGFDLGVQSLIFSQDNSGGTLTMLELVRPEAMGAIGSEGADAPGGKVEQGQAEAA